MKLRKITSLIVTAALLVTNISFMALPSSAATNGTSLDGADLYCTTMPCVQCSKMLINCGIRHIFYAEFYPDDLAQQMLGEAGVICEQVNFSPFAPPSADEAKR